MQRDDIARKSFRVPAHRATKRLAPAPPPRTDSIDKSATTLLNDKKTNELNMRNTLNSKVLSSGASASKETASPGDSRKSAATSLSSRLYYETPKMTTTRTEAIKVDGTYSLKLSDLKLSTEEFGGTLGRNEKAKKDFFNSIKDSTDGSQHKTHMSSSDALNQLEKHIHQMEIDSKSNSIFDPTPKPMVKVTNRYGDHENLLKTGISNITSGTALCYEGDEDEATEQHFQRGAASRSSTSAVVTSKLLPKTKTTKPVNRTASDTKNVENTIKMMRIALKKQDNGTNGTEMDGVRDATGPLSPLSSKKKEDMVFVESAKISNQKPVEVQNTHKNRLKNLETLRHNIITAGTSRNREREAQVIFCDVYGIPDLKRV